MKEDLPAWCRMTGNELVSEVHAQGRRSFLVSKGALVPRARRGRGAGITAARPQAPPLQRSPVQIAATPAPDGRRAGRASAGRHGMGSWPRPRWMVDAHPRARRGAARRGRLPGDGRRRRPARRRRAAARPGPTCSPTASSGATATPASWRHAAGQLPAHARHRPAAAGGRPGPSSKRELRALDVPAGEVRHPGVSAASRRSRPLAVHELELPARPDAAGPSRWRCPAPTC